MDFNKTSDIGLDLLANQNKTKESVQPQYDAPPQRTSPKTFTVNPPKETYTFKADEDIDLHETASENNYQYQPSNNNNDVLSEESVHSIPHPYDDLRPQKNYEEIMKEKYELIYKIESLKKRGVQVPGNVTVESSIDEIKYVYNKVVRDREKLTAVRFSRKMLMAFCSGLEFLNTRFDPFDLKLDGWSESVHENVTDYDEVFEELHEKYKSKTKIIPELKLLFMLGGSAFMFHLTSAMFKNTSVPGVDNILKSNPELMKQFQSAALNSMNGGGGNSSSVPIPPRNFFGMNSNNFETPTQPRSMKPQKEMKPPNVDEIMKELDLDNDIDIQNLMGGEN